MQIKKCVFALGATLLLASALQAAPRDVEKVKARLDKILPGLQPDSIANAPIGGFQEVVFGPKVVYISNDGRYLLQANIIDLETDENLTETRRAKAVKSAMGKVGEESMVVFGEKESKHTITVFTDIDCGYCRKLHKEMDDYNAAGIRIRYLFYPRAGVDSASYDKAVSVWCADDRNLAMTKSKSGEKVPDKKCDNPVTDHLRLGELMGINGTPALVLPDGELLPGYLPAKRLSKYLEGKTKTN